MRTLRSSRGLLWLGACSSFIGALAGPSINVALRASWNAAPYLVELLETAAEENATAYYPILDRIAEGYFAQAHKPQELFSLFVDLLDSDGHITDAETLSSFQFALSVRSAAPRIEAHYHFYNTSVEPSLEAQCETWASFEGQQYCSPDLEESSGSIKNERTDVLPFDRILGNKQDALSSILYADITSPSFAQFHKTLSKTAKQGKTSYRIRHKPSSHGQTTPLIVNGYGVELQLKRTDYIVIDDRQAAESAKAEVGNGLSTELHDDEEVADLKPLSASEVSNLAVNAASFVIKSDQPLDTLLKVVQDFPKHSSAIAAHNASAEFLQALDQDRMDETMPPLGYNVMWINGLPVPIRDVNPFTLLERLRRERKLINGIKSQGLSGPEAIELLSSPALSGSQVQDEPQRYDFRDTTEGGNVIMWLNDLEKDKRYAAWPTELTAFLQRTYPGQLPYVRRDVHNVIIPLDFASVEDVALVVNPIQSLIRRQIPVRWGLVPQTGSASAAEQAKVVYYLLDTYGLHAAVNYLEDALGNKKLASADKTAFDRTVEAAEVRSEREPLSLDEVLKSEAISERLANAKQYLARLAAQGPKAPIFVNGVAIPQDDDWLQMLSQRVSTDLHQIQRGVFEQTFDEDEWLPGTFLAAAAFKRNPLLIPENEKNITLINMVEFNEKHGSVLEKMPKIAATDKAANSKIYLTVVADFDTESGLALLQSVIGHHKEHENIEVVLVHNPSGKEQTKVSDDLLETWVQSGEVKTSQQAVRILANEPTIPRTPGDSSLLWKLAEPIYAALNLRPGEGGLLLNGRFVGPLPAEQPVSKDDVETLVSYEMSKRIKPLSTALKELDLVEKVISPLDFAKLQSIVALSTVSDVPDNIFGSASTVRTDLKSWNATNTVITKGDNSTAIIQIVASIDPATTLAQKWVPILKVLSEMDGTYLKIFLNPKGTLQELPVKRFYRYLLDSSPTFNDNGDIVNLEAEFTGIPKEALLNLGMDVPPSWLVAPEDSIHDLDNIRLSSLAPGANIDAIYGLESILIEGHSRDVTNSGRPPRGAELVLATEKEPHFADTIIMANLGYFQFKVNPGFYKIQLKSGRTSEVFNFDSAGSNGWLPVPGDETNEVVLMSFQGATLFPRLSRKPGKQDDDVLETDDDGLASEIMEKGAQKVSKFLGKIGLNFDAEKVLKKGSDLLSKTGLAPNTSNGKGVQADINIFSVASGHLYERMLNIMMLSVMKHTKHTVKFWFIEQFLSPNFKSFLPTMAKEYGFQYELVTYKWPHWLRGQTEKQREIWGYKILFLDVLFPLDLEKVIFVDADQIVRTDMYELVQFDLEGAPYGFTPMCDSRTSMDGFRFWKQGYWANFLRGLPYHISALYVVDLKRFRQLAAGDRLRGQYHQLSADPNSLSNLDQDLPNNMQFQLRIKSLPQEWLWCETWCADEELGKAKTIDLCNNPQTKEPKLDRARRQVPEWSEYDEEIAELARRAAAGEGVKKVVGGEDGQGENTEVKDEL